MLNYIITEDSITVLINSKPEIIDSTHPKFTEVEDVLKSGGTEAEVEELIMISKVVENFGKGSIQVENGEIYKDGKVVNSALSIRILSLIEKGFDVSPFVNFMDNLYQNPSKRAVDETYGFLEACNLPITEDGCFLAYKKVRSDYTDVYSGSFDNSIGETPNMPRNEVDENSEVTCSQGLHVASYSYMDHYPGERIVICKVNPKDVVAVPADYNNAKMRVSGYEVVGEVELKNDELPENVIRDSEIPNINKDVLQDMDVNEYEYGDIITEDELKVIMRNSTFEEIKELTAEMGWDIAYDYMNTIKKSTGFWKDKVYSKIIEELVFSI